MSDPRKLAEIEWESSTIVMQSNQRGLSHRKSFHDAVQVRVEETGKARFNSACEIPSPRKRKVIADNQSLLCIGAEIQIMPPT